MKLLNHKKLNRNEVENIDILEEMALTTLDNFYYTKLDLENGNYADIVSYRDPMRDMVSLSIKEYGCLTNKVFLEVIYHAYDGEYGLEIISDSDLEGKNKESYNIYDLYKELIDITIAKSFEK